MLLAARAEPLWSGVGQGADAVDRLDLRLRRGERSPLETGESGRSLARQSVKGTDAISLGSPFEESVQSIEVDGVAVLVGPSPFNVQGLRDLLAHGGVRAGDIDVQPQGVTQGDDCPLLPPGAAIRSTCQ